MFRVAPHEEGFAVTWGNEGADDAKELRKQLLLQGLPRGRDWASGIVVRRYRNQFETLRLLLEILEQKGITYDLDPQLTALRNVGSVEQDLLATVRSAHQRDVGVPARVKEFASGRRLLPYQCEAVGKHLLVRHSADFSVPGSGKTTVALAYWTHARREIPDLGLWVIGPLSCFRPWEEEFDACFGRPPSGLRLRGTAQQRRHQLRHAARRELLLCTYHTAWREEVSLVPLLKRRPWLLVLDEAHYIKSMTGVLAAAARHLAPFAVRRMVLTGTPMPRSPEDIWSIFTFLWPTEALLGNAVQYALRCKQTPATTLCEDLRDQLAPFFHRTRKDELRLPPIEDLYPVVAPEQVPASQRLIIRLIEQRTLEEADYLSERDQTRVRRWRRARIVRLLQAAGNPLLLAQAIDTEQLAVIGEEEPEMEGVEDQEALPLTDTDSDLAALLRRYEDNRVVPAKAEYVVRRCRELVAQGEKVVIWTVFLGNVDLLSRLLHELRPLCITGMVPAYEAEDDETGEETRERRITLFKTDPDRRVLIANAAACSESISLHRVCQHALYFERSFNAAHFIQSLDRIHRQGMPPGTTAHMEIPHIPCAVERVLNRRLRARQAQLFRFLDDPMPVVGFDDESHRGFFDLSELESMDELFAEVLTEIRAERE
jgi:superfamily II DNA or RNA helicase